MKNKIIPEKLEKVLQLINSLPKEDLGSSVFSFPRLPTIEKPPIEKQVLELIESAFQSQVKIARQHCLERIKVNGDLTETEINEFCEGGIFTLRSFPPSGPHPFLDFLKSLPSESGIINKAFKYRNLFITTFNEVGGGYLFNDEVVNEINRIIDKWLSTLPELIAKHLINFEPSYGSKHKYLEISRRYQELFRTCGQLISLAETTRGRFHKENNYQLKNYYYWIEPYFDSIQLQTEVRIEADGTARLQKSLFADAIDGIDVRRIRLCGVCETLFWAKRLDQIFCSKACSGLQRIQRWREKSSDYELNRYRSEEKRVRRASNSGTF